MSESFSTEGSQATTSDSKETLGFSRLLKHLQSRDICCPLTEMALMQSRYDAFCRQLNAILSGCMSSLRVLHLFSSGEDIVHHLTFVLDGGAAKHRAVERTRNK